MAIAGKNIPIAVLCLLLAAGAGAGWLLVRASAENPAPGPPVGEFYARVAEALTRPGMVAQVTFHEDATDPFTSAERNAWLDVRNDVAREETTREYKSPSVTAMRQSIAIYERGAIYSHAEDERTFKGPNSACSDSPKQIFALFISCPQVASAEIQIQTERGHRFDGRDALALVVSGEYTGIDSTINFKSALFVDASTYLPLGYERKGVDDYAAGGETKFRRERHYELEFVPRDSLPADFFDPSSIGYAEPDPEHELLTLQEQQKFPIFWLGREYPGTGSLPALSLSGASVIGESSDLGPRIHLFYSERSDQYDVLVNVSVMSPQRWRHQLPYAPWFRDPCQERSEIHVADTQATVYRWRVEPTSDCSSSPIGFVLVLKLGDTVVEIQPTLNDQRNPYDSVDALSTLALALQRRGA